MYGGSGVLKDLLLELRQKGIDDFATLEPILDFKKNWKSLIKQHQEEQEKKLLNEIEKIKSDHNSRLNEYQQLISDRTKELHEEKEQLPSKIIQYSSNTKNPFKFVYNKIKLYQTFKRLARLTHSFTDEVEKPFRNRNKKIKKLEQDAIYRETNFDQLVTRRSRAHVEKINHIKITLDAKYTLLAGAIGEQEAIKELTKLPDSFILINDFKKTFPDKYIPYSKELKKINSIQVDHIFIGPPGLFLIETKNWSKESLQNLNLFSPVQQIRRANFALFFHLNKLVNNGSLRLNSHHWGKKKITLRNILLMTNAKPKEQFQFVKVLHLKEIVSYILYFEETFSSKEVERIANYIRRR